ncbi:hypothetical protein [Promicromonospora sp. NPDC057488]|uniref:hypothetical protein n=1 Tax=Promicromonospora sp. NPDC057488 TaxID=3346147 RepID=UPI00366D3F34
MSDETIGSANPGSTEQKVHGSAGSLALGLGLVLGGAAVLYLVLGLRLVPNEAALVLFMFIGGTAIVVGAVQLVIGVYQLADNVDRMAKAVLNRESD